MCYKLILHRIIIQMFNFIPAYAGKIPTIPVAMPKLNNIIMTFISTWHTS